MVPTNDASVSGPERAIRAFSRDAEEVWVAELECGHRQHVRHDPPLVRRPWVLTAAGRSSKLGERLPCRYCLMGQLPPSARVYKTTDWFDEGTIPAGMLRSHRLAPNTWGRIVVAEGRLLYTIERSPEMGFVLSPTLQGIAEPEQPHRVEARGPVRFRVEFLRAP